MDRPTVHVLVVENGEDDYILTCDMLAAAKRIRFRPARAATYEVAREVLARNSVDVALVAHDQGANNGLDLVRELKAHGCTVPFLLLSKRETHGLDVAALEAGMADYLVKGQIDAPELERTIRSAMEQKKTEATLRHRAEQLEALQRVGLGLAAQLELDALLRFIY